MNPLMLNRRFSLSLCVGVIVIFVYKYFVREIDRDLVVED
jgi:hypothetical protein